jgi:SAM-dependent methyltransferase
MMKLAVKLLKRVGLYSLIRPAYLGLSRFTARCVGFPRACAKAVGRVVSSLASALAYRWDQVRYKKEAAGLPIPPRELNYLVTNVRDVLWYVEGGKRGFQSISMALERNGVQLKDLSAVLDFGCGSGRVIRYWRNLPAKVYGVDYNPRMIEWCRAKLKFAHFQTNRLEPPLGYPVQSFDLIYALSVFTHLDEKNQHSWIQELTRVLKPGGYLLITTHGPCPFYLGTLGKKEREKLAEGDLVVVSQGAVGSNSYAAYHSENYVRTKLARGLTVVDFLSGGAFGNPFQDIYLLKRPASSLAKGAAA